MTRYAKKFKADKNTLFGLSGLGDLILTCSSTNSRNTQFGIKLASSKYDNFLDLLKSQEVTEGYYTVKAVYNISQKKIIEMKEILNRNEIPEINIDCEKCAYLEGGKKF